MRRAGLYARVSREEQAEGYSVDAQLEAMHQFCQAKGWTIASEYVDPGASGTTQDRPAFLKLLADCEAGQLDVIVTHQLDRLMRNLRLQLDILGRLGEWKVAYVSVTEQIDYSAPQGSLFLSMLGTFNEYYVANLKREIRKGKRGRARKGLPNNSRMICGYKRKGDKIVVDPEGAVAARFMFEKYATGHYSLQALASLMNQRFPQEARWSPRRVGDGLKNPLYIGQVRYHDHVYRGHHRQRSVAARPTDTCPPQTEKDTQGQAFLIAVWPGPLPLVQATSLVTSATMQVVLLLFGHAPGHRLCQQRNLHGAECHRTKLRRLRDLYLEEGDLGREDYRKRKAQIQARLAALVVPETVQLEEVAATLQTIAEV
jgi:DNA invertase Pin-like site-specific DNA recombinase